MDQLKLNFQDQQQVDERVLTFLRDHPEGINVLSLFDGMSCGQIALERAGIKVKNYYASEVDKYAIQIAKKNYPDTIHLGDVRGVKGSDLPEIHLLIGGSPCQGFSFAGKQLNFEDPRSKLFFEYVRLLKELDPVYFLLENVKMKKESENVISQYLGVQPININSALVSAQHRKRLYWTNIPGIVQPEDQGLLLKDVILSDERAYGEAQRDRYVRGKIEQMIELNGTEKSNALTTVQKDSLMLSQKALDYMNRKVKGGRTHWDFDFVQELCKAKAKCLTANLYKGVPYNVLIVERPLPRQQLENPPLFRKLAPIECERLQTLPDNYTDGVSNTQRYKMIGNGWTVDVIAHIFSFLNQN